MCDSLNKRRAFEQIIYFVKQKKVKDRVNLRLIRFWAKNTKAKVFKALMQNIEIRSKDREMAFKKYMFEENRLMRLGIRVFIANT